MILITTDKHYFRSTSERVTFVVDVDFAVKETCTLKMRELEDKRILKTA